MFLSISSISKVRLKLTKDLVSVKKKSLTSMKLWQGLKRLMIKPLRVDSKKLKTRFSETLSEFTSKLQKNTNLKVNTKWPFNFITSASMFQNNQVMFSKKLNAIRKLETFTDYREIFRSLLNALCNFCTSAKKTHPSQTILSVKHIKN